MAVNIQTMFSDVKLNRELDILSVVSKEQNRRSIVEASLAKKLINILGEASAKASVNGMFAQKHNIANIAQRTSYAPRP